MSRRAWMIAVFAAVLGMASAPSVHAATKVPPGNRNVEQPAVPGGSAKRTAALKTTYEAKYKRVVALLRGDEKLRRKIIQTARRFSLDPIHMIGAIVGEHTYNVDAYDSLQSYYIKAISYVNSSFAFSHGGESVDTFIRRPEFESCAGLKDSYALWTCRENVWDEKFRGKSAGGRKFPNDRFSAVFFQPFFAGQTFGLGQLNPLTALQMTDLVVKVSGGTRLSHLDPQEVYRTIMDPDQTLPYIAATLVKSIEAYRDIAGFDISGNPGITATLYNLGNPEARARALRRENAARAARGQAPRLPAENYYGWLINDRIEELRTLVQ